MRLGSLLIPAAASAAVALTLTTPARAQDVPDIPYQKYVLGNGLTLIVHEDHKAPIVAVNVWYHVGSKNEKAGKTGFAHLFEHLMFQKSENNRADYIATLEALGATDLNGTTNNDRTNYFQNVPVTALDTVLWLESDRMGHLLGVIDQAVLDEQRGVVQNEKRQGENQPYGLAYDLITQASYPKGHPYSWSTIGSMEDLNAASLDDVKEWFRTYYGAANATLVVAGDVNPDDVKARVEKYFGDIPPGPPIAKHQTWVAKRSGAHRQALQDRVPQARLYKVWNTPEWGSQDDVRLGLVASVLASGRTSRLYKRLVYDDQIATQVSAVQDASEIGSSFIIQATARPGVELARVEAAIDEELRRFLAEGPKPEELQRARTEELAGFVRGVERVGGFGGKSDVLAQSQVWGGSPDAWKKRLERVKGATPAELGATAKEWLSDGVYALEVHPFPELAEAKAGAGRASKPEAGKAPAASFPAFQRATLPNGLKLVVAERHAVPVVNFDLLVDAGYASDQLAIPGTAKLAGNMLDQGTKSRSSLEIAEALAQLGANLATGSSVDTTTVTLSALKANLDKSLELFADVILNPSFPQADFDRLKSQQAALIQREKVQPNSMALRVLPKLLYGEGHAYATPLTGSGTAISLAKIAREDAARFHAGWFRPNNATLIVVGDTTLAEIQPKLERLFASWAKGEVPKKNIGAARGPAASAVYILDRPGAQQSVIFAGQLAPPKANPKEIAIEAMNNVLGGQFSARLNMNLREDKHWSYGAFTFFFDARGQRPFFAYAPVQTDKTKEALAEVVKELTDVRGSKPPTAEELALAKNAATLTLSGQWETAEAVAGSLSQIVTYGLDDRYFDTYATRVTALGVKDLADAAQVVDPARTVYVVVGDRAKVEAGVREQNLGPVKFLDADGSVLP